jgi:thiol-disulfide isomerase/thioredoxin
MPEIRSPMRKYFILVCLFIPTSLFGQEVPLLTVNQLDERLSNGKDTIYLVNFWATWCAPCIEELPYFEKLTDMMKGKPVKVLLVSLDFKSKLETAVKPFVKKLNLNSEVFLINERSQQDYINRIDKNWSGAIPATLVVNANRRSRKLIEKELTYDELLNLYKTNVSDE